MMGLTHPDHKLNHAYKRVIGVVPSGLKPSRFLDALGALTELGGNAETATRFAQKAPYLLRHTAQGIRLRHAHMCRLATVLGWNGDVNEFIRDKPNALIVGHKKMRFLGQLAARFAKPEHKDLGHAQLNTILNKAPELHLARLLQRERAYEFGQGADNHTPINEWQQYIYKELANKNVAERVGYNVLKAYLRLRPPSDAALKKYPHLAFLRQGRPAEAVERKEPPKAIVGNEAWLEHTSIPIRGRTGWLTKVNSCTEAGSRSIAGRRPEGDVYEEVLHARIMFFRLLGWTSPPNESR